MTSPSMKAFSLSVGNVKPLAETPEQPTIIISTNKELMFGHSMITVVAVYLRVHMWVHMWELGILNLDIFAVMWPHGVAVAEPSVN